MHRSNTERSNSNIMTWRQSSLVVGSSVCYMYGEDGRMKIPPRPYQTESVMYRAELLKPGSFGRNNVVAVKKFCIDSSSMEAAQITNSDLQMRWRIMTKLKHHNVVSYKTAIQWMHSESDSSPSFIELHFVMDYCDGSDLGSMIDGMFKTKRSLHVKTLFDFSKQMTDGLAYLHKNNIIHGDLKPNSVVVDQSSMNHFRLRLCGLDCFSSSYAAFVRRRCCAARFLAPEVRTIINEGASLVLDDPVFSAFHKIQKRLATGSVISKATSTLGAELLEKFIDQYGLYCQFQRMKGRKDNIHLLECFSELLQFMMAAISRLNARHCFRAKLIPEILSGLQEICSREVAAQQCCADREYNVDHSDAQGEAPAVKLDTVMSAFFQHIRSPTTAFQEPSSLAGVESRLLSNPNESLRVDGRKADIWSLGMIMQDLAELTFDKFRKTRMSDVIDLRALNNGFMQRFNDQLDSLDFYANSFIPYDFKKILISCQYRSADERLTAEELINRLVGLEEHTYGSTWVSNPQDAVTETDQSNSHREMLEKIGCTCAYDYTFWRDFLGQGTYGHVYEARITDAGTYKGNGTVAVKQVTLSNIRTKHMKKDGSWERAKEQWQKLVELRHPHLVTYHNVTLWKLTQGASIEFMMDYCQGGDLEALITQCKTGIQSLSVEAVFSYAGQLANGLRFLHEKQFIHGDLKPGNVFMDAGRVASDVGNRTLRIGDLDSAVRIRDDCSKTEGKDLAGTGPYMSPEMVMHFYEQEPEDIGYPTDVWSLGCVILDLANCSVGIKERTFYKTVMNAEGKLEIQKIERQSFSADAFLFQLSQGFRPFISELIHQDARDVIQSCLLPACSDRATAALIVEQLLTLNLENTVSISYCLKRYGTAKLFDICAEYAIKNMDKSSCWTTLEVAKVLDAKKLVAKCFEIVDIHCTGLLQSEGFLQLKKETLREIFSRNTLIVKEEQVYKAAQRWATNACRSSGRELTGTNCRIVLGEALFAVRFPLMDDEQLANGPLAAGLLLDEELDKIYQFKYAPKKPDTPFLGVLRSSDIAFCDRRWIILDTSFRNDRRSMTTGNVFLDGNGHLHLRVSQHDGVWKGARVRLREALGFGRYEFHLEGLDRLVPNAGFMLVLAEETQCARDFDIRVGFVKVADADGQNSCNCLRFSVQRPNADWVGFNKVAEEPGDSLSTHSFHWRPGSVSFSSQRGHQRNSTEEELGSWFYDYRPTIAESALPLHIFCLPYTVDMLPYDGKEFNIVVHSFRFYPDE